MKTGCTGEAAMIREAYMRSLRKGGQITCREGLASAQTVMCEALFLLISAGIDVYVHNARAGCKGLQLSCDAVVKADADGQQQVGLVDSRSWLPLSRACPASAKHDDKSV